MRKILLFVFVLCFAATSGFAQYQTAGDSSRLTLPDLVASSNGAVTFLNNTYFINDTITIAETDTLVITTNETLKLAEKVLFTISGTFLVNPPDSVKITAIDTTKRFHSLRFTENSDASVIRKTIIEYGSGIKLTDADIMIDSCVIRYHSRTYNSGAINASGSRFTVTRSRIHDNARAAILTPTNIATSPIITHNHIYNNATENGNYPQINLGIGDTAVIVITDNLVEGKYPMSGGIAVSNLLGSPRLIRAQIDRNIIRNNRYGIAIMGPNINSYVRDNIIENNNIGGNAQTGGSGINLVSTTPNQFIIAARNKITGNLWGITLQSGPRIQPGPQLSLGRINRTDTADVGLNEIYNNGNNGSIFDVYNNTSDTVWAQNNYWGTDSVSVIEDHIYHYADSTLHGFVNYLPLRQSTVTGLPKAVAQALHADVFPNPVQSIATFRFGGLETKNETATLVIYDQLGREVARLLDNEPVRQEQMQWEPQHLANGLYFFRLTTKTTQQSGKILLKR